MPCHERLVALRAEESRVHLPALGDTFEVIHRDYLPAVGIEHGMAEGGERDRHRPPVALFHEADVDVVAKRRNEPLLIRLGGELVERPQDGKEMVAVQERLRATSAVSA